MADLITIDTYKQAKALTSAKDDERLSVIVPAVSNLVKTYCGNAFVDYIDTAKVEYIDLDWDIKDVQLTESPLIAVESVSVRDSETEDYYDLTTDEYAVSNRTDMVRKLDGYWPKGMESVKVTYTAGYEELPGELTLALIDLIAYYFKEEYKVSKTLSGASMQNSQSSTIDTNIGFPDHIKRVLDMYRQI